MSLISQNINPCRSTYRKDDGSSLESNIRATQDLPIQDLRRRLVSLAKQRDLNEKDVVCHRGAAVSPTREGLLFRFNEMLRRVFGLS